MPQRTQSTPRKQRTSLRPFWRFAFSMVSIHSVRQKSTPVNLCFVRRSGGASALCDWGTPHPGLRSRTPA